MTFSWPVSNKFCINEAMSRETVTYQDRITCKTTKTDEHLILTKKIKIKIQLLNLVSGHGTIIPNFKKDNLLSSPLIGQYYPSGSEEISAPSWQ
jgi:hypothetical protein